MDDLDLEPALFPSASADLTVVGTGMKFYAHLTLEALAAIRRADRVHFVAADVMTERWLKELNPHAERLPGYLPDRKRRDSYEQWVDVILGSVRAGHRTCAASYGHPAMLVHFSREAIRRARAEGYSAVMLPGISTDAAMLCDLLLDPGPTGWQSYPAPLLLRRRPRVDTGTPLVVWQLRVANAPGPPTEIDRRGLAQLAQYLIGLYGAAHEVIVYEASRNPAVEPLVQRLPLERLPRVRFRQSATLYVPALPESGADTDGVPRG